MFKLLKVYKFSLLILLGIFIGISLGLIFGEKASILKPIADLFLNLLFTVVPPLIFTSLVTAIGEMNNLKRLGKTLGSMIGIFVVTGIIAAFYMISVLSFFDISQGYVLPNTIFSENISQNTDVLSMFTVSDFSLLLSRRNLLALIVFTIIFGISLALIGERGKSVTNIFKSLSEVFIKFVGIIMYIAPFGLCALFAVVVGEFGKELLEPLYYALLVYFIAAFIYYIASNTIFSFIGGGRLGVKKFWQEIITPSLTSLGTSSSAATIPVNVIAAKNIGVPQDIANLTIPMGANLHKNGGILTQVLKIIFLFGVYNMNFFTPENIFLAVFVSLLVSIILSAIPSGGYVGEIFIVSLFGFPLEAIPIMALIGTITDPLDTLINATGDTGVSMILTKIVDGKNWIKNAATNEA